MSFSHTAFSRIIFKIAGIIVGLWLCFFLPEMPADWWSLETTIMFVGFFIFFFSMVSLVADGLRAIKPPTTRLDAAAWEIKRADGKTAYVRRFVAKGIIPSLAVLAALSLVHFSNNDVQRESILFLVFLVLMIFLSLIGAGRVIWDYNQREHDSVVRVSEPPTNSSK